MIVNTNLATGDHEPYTPSNSMKAANFMASLNIALIDYQLPERPIPVFIKKLAALVQADD